MFCCTSSSGKPSLSQSLQVHAFLSFGLRFSMLSFVKESTLIEEVLQYIDVASVGRLAACCAGMRGDVVDDEGRVLVFLLKVTQR